MSIEEREHIEKKKKAKKPNSVKLTSGHVQQCGLCQTEVETPVPLCHHCCKNEK